jgi:hypothetical protein
MNARYHADPQSLQILVINFVFGRGCAKRYFTSAPRRFIEITLNQLAPSPLPFAIEGQQWKR